MLKQIYPELKNNLCEIIGINPLDIPPETEEKRNELIQFYSRFKQEITTPTSNQQETTRVTSAPPGANCRICSEMFDSGKKENMFRTKYILSGNKTNFSFYMHEKCLDSAFNQLLNSQEE